MKKAHVMALFAIGVCQGLPAHAETYTTHVDLGYEHSATTHEVEIRVGESFSDIYTFTNTTTYTLSIQANANQERNLQGETIENDAFSFDGSTDTACATGTQLLPDASCTYTFQYTADYHHTDL